MIRFNNVSKTYYSKNKNTLALNNVSFELPSIGFIGLSGENGCGKTTLLNLLSTIDNEFEGSITIDNYDVKHDYSFIRKNIVSYVLQENLFINELNSKENIEIFCGNTPSINNIDEFNLNDQINKNVYELSGGQKQKVALLRGLLKKSSILLVDEPTSSLDEKTTKQVFEILSNISKSKLVILVSHDMEMMNAYCNLIVKLNSGELEYIKNNNTVSDVIYEDDSAIFYGDVNLHSISIDKMNESLNKHGYFKIIKKDKNQINDHSSNNINNNIIDNYYFSKDQRKLLFKAYFKSIYKKIISFVLICTLLLFCFEIFYDFKTIDKDDFYYETLSKNDNGNVIFEQDTFYDDDERFTLDEAIYLKDNYNTYVDFGYEIESDLSLPYDYDPFYSPIIRNIIYTDFSHYEFSYGTRPNNTNSIVITDYTADAVMKYKKEYKSYSDICEKGIDINNQRINVSGILKTDYLNYLDIGYSDEKKSYNYDRKKDKVFSCIYCEYINEKKDISFVYDRFNEIIVKIVFSDTQSDLCKVSKALANVYEYDGTSFFEIKTMFCYMSILGISDEETDDYIIYYPKKRAESYVNSLHYDYYITNVSSREVFDYLQQNSLEYLTYSALKVRESFRILDLLKSLFLGIMIGLFIIIGVNTFTFIIKVNKKNNNLYCLMTLSGIPLKEFMFVEVIVNLTSLILLILVNCFVYFIGYIILNAILMNVYDLSLSLFNSHFITFIISILIQFIILFIIYFIYILIRKKKNLRKLIK